MENEIMNEVVATEAVRDITTQATAPSNGMDLKNVAIAGGIMTLGALAWEFGVKPIGRKVKKAIVKAKEKRKEKPAAAVQDSDNDENIYDVEKEYPID